jgi:N-acetylglucosaminyldiphosphoundecaprenol N-acetyl-beta-D-mannosaminyltransferase
MNSEIPESSNQTHAFPSLEILGVKVNVVDRKALLQVAIAWASQDQFRTIAYANTHCLNVAYKDEAYRDILNSSDLVTVDGVGVVWAGRVLKGIRLYKVTSRTFIDDLCRMAAESHLKLFILAGSPGIASKTAALLRCKHQGLTISGTADGFFVEKTEAQVLAEIKQARPDMLLVGMGVPRQEKWIKINRENLAVPVCWGLGALFDYVAGIEPAVPSFLDRLGLEWFWRLVIDPRRKWHRYLIGNPTFIWRVLMQKFSVK